MELLAQSNTASRRSDIVRAAKKAFLEVGYAGTSVDDVAREAGVSKPTIYKHFQSKERLFQTILETEAALIDRSFEGVVFNRGTLHEALDAFGRRFLRAVLSPEVRSIYRIMIAEGFKFPELGEAFRSCACLQLHDRLVKILNTYVERKVMHCRCANMASDHFLGLLMQPTLWKILVGRTDMPSDEKLEHIVADAVAVFTHYYSIPAGA